MTLIRRVNRPSLHPDGAVQVANSSTDDTWKKLFLSLMSVNMTVNRQSKNSKKKGLIRYEYKPNA